MARTKASAKPQKRASKTPTKVTKPKPKPKPKPIPKPVALSKADKASGYAKIPGDSARRWRKIGGRKVISRRQHDALLAREGFAKQEAPKQFSGKKTGKYWRMVESYQSATKTTLNKREVSRSKEFKRELTEFQNSSDNKPGGVRARFLEKLGWRNPQATYNVGETPRRRKK